MSTEKLVVDIGKINDKIKLKFVLILEDDSGTFPMKITKFYNNGNANYYKVAPRPLLCFELIPEDNKNKNSFNGFSVTKFMLFRLISDLRDFIDLYKDEDAFYINEHKKLIVNKVKQKENEKYIPVCGNQAICLSPAVVYVQDDGGTGQKEYEGAILYLNNKYIYVNLTYTELKFLLYTLEKIDFEGWSLNLMTNFKLYSKEMEKEIYNFGNQEERTLEGRGFNIEPHREIPNLN